MGERHHIKKGGGTDTLELFQSTSDSWDGGKNDKNMLAAS